MKKIIRILIICLCCPIGLLVMGIAILKVKNEIYLGSADKEFVEYLNKNSAVFPENAFVDHQIEAVLGENFLSKEIILLGESHGYDRVQQLDGAILKFLNRRAGLRYYIAEMDSISAVQLNRFLNNGIKDGDLLAEVVNRVKRTIPQQAGIQLFDKWSDIYDYNRTLPDSLKITVIGLDIDPDAGADLSRDEEMARNFRNVYRTHNLAGEKFYGLFGLFHVMQNGLGPGDFQPLAARLKKDGFSVVSIACFDIESRVYFPRNDYYPTPRSETARLFGMDGPLVLVRGIKDIKKTSHKNSLTLFNIDNPGSPYHQSNKFMENKVNFFGGGFSSHDPQIATTCFFQYVVLIRGAGPVTPLL